ncbi:unnamed protein product, partial [Ectocarpus sp. 12 AP-2014]
SREDAVLQEDFTWTQRSTIENILKYNRSFGKHNIDLTGLISFEKFESKTVGVGVIGFASNETQVLGAGEDSSAPTGSEQTTTLSGLMGRFLYNFDEKYLFSASIRRDGTSVFSEENRIGIFPGFSAGWNISEENFLKNSESISNLKLRASWAEVGNQSLNDPYVTTSRIEGGVNYLFDTAETSSAGYIQRRIANSDLKWETKISKNIGVDLSMFNNRFTFTADVYKNDRKEMILNLQTPPSAGTTQPRDANTYSNILINAGDMTNQGIELAASYRSNAAKAFKWDVAAKFTTNDNEIQNLNGIERG